MENTSVETLELQAYETPEVFEAGSFAEDTGALGLHGAEPFFPTLHTSWW
ncbi:keywimysin-related RiPP [Streptomyces rubellomurinus]|uniref:Keywimysin-related RiPP n=1 Tax=Streptomyces sp. Y1 TaxID=3238634 RepID=A0AB39TSX0_9ACTN|nr:keywimysin-related RiPP [Streptomyces rubellomurinus]